MNQFNYLETHIVDHCNLNCIGCFHCAPLAKPKYYDLETFEKRLRQIKTFAPEFLQFTILGGEPLLHPQFLDFCKVARKYFNDVQVITNGLLFKGKSQEFFDTLNNLNILIQYSNYIDDNELLDLLNTKIHRLQILDHPDMAVEYFDFKADCNKEQVFKICTSGGCCLNLDGDYIYHCCFEAWSKFLFDKFKCEPNTYDRTKDRINIWDIKSIDEVIEFINKPSTFCRYCVQYLPENNHTTPWQQSKKELTEWVRL